MMVLPLKREARKYILTILAHLVLMEVSVNLIVIMNWLLNMKMKRRMGRKSTLLALTLKRIKMPRIKRLALQLRAAALAETCVHLFLLSEKLKLEAGNPERLQDLPRPIRDLLRVMIPARVRASLVLTLT
jgi:hypothetical protein